jgi:hypothetical protein
VNPWDDLWGATLVAVDVDLLSRRITITASVVDGGESYTLDVSLDGVSEVRITRVGDEPWDYAEITEARCSEVGDQAEVELVLWSEPNELVARCATATIERRA